MGRRELSAVVEMPAQPVWPSTSVLGSLKDRAGCSAPVAWLSTVTQTTGGNKPRDARILGILAGALVRGVRGDAAALSPSRVASARFT